MSPRPAPLTAEERRALRRAECAIRAISDTALVRLGEALRAIRDGHLYRGTDASWTAYLERTLGTTPQFAAALMSEGGRTRLQGEWSYHLQGGRKASHAHMAEHHARWLRLKELAQCPACGDDRARLDVRTRTLSCQQCGQVWPESDEHAQAQQAYYGLTRSHVEGR